MKDHTNINIGIFFALFVFGMASLVAQNGLECTLYRRMSLNFWSSLLHPVLELQIRVTTVGECNTGEQTQGFTHARQVSSLSELHPQPSVQFMKLTVNAESRSSQSS